MLPRLKVLRLLVPSLVLVGCATYSPVPSDYQGPTARISDTYDRVSGGTAKMYYVAQVDGNPIPNALTASRTASQGQGSRLTALGMTRRVLPEPLELYLAAEVFHPAPIQYLFSTGKNYRVQGVVTFQPEPDRHYFVRGVLGDSYAAVWLEDLEGNIITTPVETFEAGDPMAAEARRLALEGGDRTVLDPRSEFFLNLASGIGSDVVLDVLGPPATRTQRDANFLISRPATEYFVYNDLGTIRFICVHGGHLSVERVTPIGIASDASPEVVRSQLKSARGVTLQSLARGYHTTKETNPAVLDVLAQAIWEARASREALEVDAMAWLCKTLGQSGNPRYRWLLGEVAEVAGEQKLRRYASANLRLLPEEDVEQFEPAP